MLSKTKAQSAFSKKDHHWLSEGLPALLLWRETQRKQVRKAESLKKG